MCQEANDLDKKPSSTVLTFLLAGRDEDLHMVGCYILGCHPWRWRARFMMALIGPGKAIMHWGMKSCHFWRISHDCQGLCFPQSWRWYLFELSACARLWVESFVWLTYPHPQHPLKWVWLWGLLYRGETGSGRWKKSWWHKVRGRARIRTQSNPLRPTTLTSLDPDRRRGLPGEAPSWL